MSEQIIAAALGATPWAVSLLVELFLKSTVLLGGVFLLIAAARRLSSSERHLIVAGALIGLLALPWIVSLAPSLTLPIASWNPAWQSQPVSRPVDSERLIESRSARRASASVSHSAEAVAAPESSRATEAPVPNARRGLSDAVVMSYLAVVLGLLSHLGLCAWRVSRRMDTLAPVRDAAVAPLVDAARSELGIARTVRLVTSGSEHTPWAWGIAQPVIVLPRDFNEWSVDCQRSALVHELAHIQRCDLLTALVARASVALFWYQPLAWAALRRMIREAENACDDRVLLDGAEDTAYARQLLKIANRIYAAGDAFTAERLTPAMAKPSMVGRRIRSILDASMRRTTVTKSRIAGAGAVSAALIGVLGVLTTSDSQETQPSAVALTDSEFLAIERDGPGDSEELERLVTTYLANDRHDDAVSAFVEYIARPTASRPICEFCASLLPMDNTPRRTALNGTLRTAFELLEEQAYRTQDGDLMYRIASILISGTDREAASRGAWYLFEALRLGNLDDAETVELLAVRALVQLGRLDDARSLARQLHEDPTSPYYQSEEIRSWMAYIDREIGRAGALSEWLLAVDARQRVQNQDYLPVYKFRPVYPGTAVEQQMEGSVVVEFTVNERGRTQDLSVVESTDPVFEISALEAAAQFLYMPKVVNGVAVSTLGVKNKITFEMELSR